MTRLDQFTAAALAYVGEHHPGNEPPADYDEVALWNAAVSHAIGGPTPDRIKREGIRRDQFTEVEYVRLLIAAGNIFDVAFADPMSVDVRMAFGTVVPENRDDLRPEQLDDVAAAQWYWTVWAWLVNVRGGLSDATSDMEFGTDEIVEGSR